MSEKVSRRYVNGLILLGIILSVSLFYGIIIFNYVFVPFFGPGAPQGITLIWGMSASPSNLDPTDSWDNQANTVIRQCTESLWWYNYSDPEFPLIRMLAEDEHWISSTQLRVTCRAGVFFHDRTPFTADAAIWNLERLEYLCNHTGYLDPVTQRVAKTASLYEFPDGTPIIDHFTKISLLVFDIHLTAPFSDLLDIYAYICGNMLSPTAHASQAERFITLQETLIGTGPFIFDEYVADIEVRFDKNEYYNGPPGWEEPPYFDKLVFSIISDPFTRSYAMLYGDIDWIQEANTDLYDNYRESPYVTLHENEIPEFDVAYLGMNYNTINETWRKAISYAVNYTYFISDYHQDTVLRAYSPVSPAFGSYYKEGIEVIAPYMNYKIARQAILDGLGADARLAGLTATEYGDEPTNDANWDTTNLITFNFTGFKNLYRVHMLSMFQFWLRRIGINVTDGLTTNSYLAILPRPKLNMELFLYAWSPDYLSPMNLIQPLMSNTSSCNAAEVNDPQMETWFVQWSVTTDFAKRVELCHNISEYITTVLYSHVWLYYPKIVTIHAADLYNCPYNALGHFWAYPIRRNYTWEPY